MEVLKSLTTIELRPKKNRFDRIKIWNWTGGCCIKHVYHLLVILFLFGVISSAFYSIKNLFCLDEMVNTPEMAISLHCLSEFSKPI